MVYEAEDLNLGRHVALKVLPTAFARDAERMARFEREAKVLASLNHPNIASIYGLENSGGLENSTQALVMELAAGPTLAERIRSGPLPIDEALRIAKQIAEALEYAHEHGIVHRDLKPANVKVTGDDTVKVLDFGLAKAVEGDAASADFSNSPTISRMATQAGVLLGTAAYMAPEQAKGKPVDRRADIWAFGCVLYEMLTGRMAFRGEDVTETLAAVIRGEPDWSRLPAATPVRVRVLLEHCLRKDPKQRLRDIGDARISLDETLSGAPEPVPQDASQAVAPRWRRALPWALFGLAVVVAAALAAALAFLHSRQKPIATAVSLEMPLPKNASLSPDGSFALSPDGRQLAFYAAGSDGVQRLWVRSLDSPTARPLPGSDPHTGTPFFWSPDSRYIAFDAGGKLEKIDLSGDPPQTICDLSGLAVGGSWSGDGVILFASSKGILRVSANGGPVTRLTAPDRSSHDVLPVFLPDGRHFFYKRSSSKAGTSDIYIGSLDAKPDQQDTKQLLATDYGVVYAPSSGSGSGSGSGMGRLLFLRDGTLMAQPFNTRRLALAGEPVTVAEPVAAYADFGFFSASKNGVLVYRTGGGGDLQLTWFDRQGKVLGSVREPGDYRMPALSPDGTQAAVGLVNHQDNKRSLWLVDLSEGTSTRFTFGSADAENPIWSLDGKRILFASKPDGHYDLYQKPANGATGEELLLKSDETKFATSVSRGGRFLLYYSIDPKTKRDLWVLPLEGDKKPFLFLRTASNEWDGHFSPDGQWVAYLSDESGHDEIYVRRFSPDSTEAATGADTGGKWQVSYGGGEWPQWSKDGKELYYLTPDNKVMVVAVSANPVFQAGAAKLLFQAPPQASGGTFGDYTVDGKRFLFLAPAQQTGQAPFNVVLNWQEGLKK